MPKSLRTGLLCSLLTLVVGCASDPASRPSWAEAPDADLPAAETFGWADRAGQPPAMILDNQIRAAVRAALVSKGYQESVEAPDFVLRHETIEAEAVDEGNPVRIGIGLGSWGGRVGGSVGTSVDVGGKDRVVQQQRIAVRVLDPEQRRELWVGTTAPLSERPDQAAIGRAVAELLEAFPARGS